MNQATENSTAVPAPAQAEPSTTTNQPPRRRLRLRAVLLRLAALAASVAVTAGIIELMVRMVYGEQPKFPRHVVAAPWGLRYNEPGAQYRHKSADGTWYFHINQQGMRADRDYSYEKPPGVRRIIALGDSMTAGLEVANEQTYCSVLERELNRAGLKTEVLNAGVSGFSPAEECLYLERELTKYSPDAVIVAFFNNDLEDDVRTGLFKLDGDRLVLNRETYVPAGRLGNFLNTNRAFNFFAERSDAFCLAKERLTLLVKWKMAQRNVPGPSDAPARAAADATAVEKDALAGGDPYQRRLLAAIYERMYQGLRAKGIPLIVQSIPSQPLEPLALTDDFPRDQFATDRPGLHYLSDKTVMEPYLGKRLLFWTRSQKHMTPFSHELAGKALAELVLRNGLLERSRPSPGPDLESASPPERTPPPGD